MRILAQIGIVLFVCLLGEAIAAVLPFPFPASVIGMVLLFLLLACKWLKPRHIQEKSNFLLSNMAFFFIPAGAGLLDYLDVLKANLVPLLVICLVTTPLVFLVTGWTVQAVMKWTARKEDKPDV